MGHPSITSTLMRFLTEIPVQSLFLASLFFILVPATGWLATFLALSRAKKQLLYHSFQAEQHHKDLCGKEESLQDIRADNAHLLAENKSLTAQIAGLRTALTESRNKYDGFHSHLEATQEQLNRQFQLMAEKIFGDKNRAMAQQHHSSLELILQPVRDQIAEFKRRVEDVYDRESRDRVSLAKEIEHLKTLNEQISSDAINLTNALKGRNKLQGFWGEMILEKLLEDSGLRLGQEYTVQQSLKNDQGRELRPDVIIRLPGDRHLIIDSKVSITAYEKACKHDDQTKRNELLQRHLDSIRKHTQDLAKKNYHQLPDLQCPDFVLLFLPVESAFQAALALDPGLTTWAARRKVILSSPSTLLAILRTINHIWRQDEQSRNARLIARQAGSLYDKVTGFLEVFEDIGARLEQSHNAWKTARKRLVSGRGNIVSRTEFLKELGVQPEKSLQDILSNSRTMTEEPPTLVFKKCADQSEPKPDHTLRVS